MPNKLQVEHCQFKISKEEDLAAGITIRTWPRLKTHRIRRRASYASLQVSCWGSQSPMKLCSYSCWLQPKAEGARKEVVNVKKGKSNGGWKNRKRGQYTCSGDVNEASGFGPCELRLFLDKIGYENRLMIRSISFHTSQCSL
jgi:hypothetical protein